MDLAAKCVMEDKQDACLAIKNLPELADVNDDTDPHTFLTAEEMVSVSAPQQLRMPLNSLQQLIPRLTLLADSIVGSVTGSVV